MSQNSNINKFNTLRKKFQYFIYESYEVSLNNNILEIKYHFNLGGIYHFYPEINIPIKPFFKFDGDYNKDLNNLVFHIGMIELISYWKAACPPKLIIKPHSLNSEQISWWKELYFHGLGEFYYLNNIETTIEDFMDISADEGECIERVKYNLSDELIIPVGGGKDSAVSLELLSEFKETNSPMMINPGKASLNTIEAAEYNNDNIIEVHRILHPQLLKLNSEGFLNGHTPFSALLAFISALTAAVSGKRNIALSNESSANEATIPGTMINHQYSKSFEYEKSFREYLNKYISIEINYFSFLRPINELQIAKLFSNHKDHFFTFRSCNRGSKTNMWCGVCSKCLFTYIIMSPYIEDKVLIKIFEKNLLDDKELINTFNQLTGIDPNKPFECVGTIDEVNIALCMTINNNNDSHLPYLLDYYKRLAVYSRYSGGDFSILYNQFEENNFLPDHLKNILINALCLKN